jgi:lambda family phage portal protein
MDQARARLRQWGRHLDENHDLTHSILDILSFQASAVTLEPRVRRRDGTPHAQANDRLRAEWLRHRDDLDVAGTMSWCVLAALAARTWLRDGEVFVQHMLGTGPAAERALPYAMQLHEPDLVPFDDIREAPRVVHGVEVNRFGRPLAYHLYRSHPGDNLSARSFSTETVRIPAQQMTHCAWRKRIAQIRGASVLAPAITRLADVSDYEESERLAAKVASSMCATITRAADFTGPNVGLDSSSGERPMELQPGVIFDGLMPGERVEILSTSRPNSELAPFRKSMLRAACAGVGVSYSSATHDYDGTYSSQRQELVETHGQRYRQLREQFFDSFYVPVWRRVVQAFQLRDGGALRGADPDTLFDVESAPPGIPSIDIQKEVNADALLVEAGLDSRHGVIRSRGRDPLRVDDERAADTQAPEPEPEPDPDREVEEDDQRSS